MLPTCDLNDSVGGHGAALGVDPDVGSGDVAQFLDLPAGASDDGSDLRLVDENADFAVEVEIHVVFVVVETRNDVHQHFQRSSELRRDGQYSLGTAAIYARERVGKSSR